ncbi:tetratricopeptide repeat protein [Pseudoalteromonas denitrificans]|uniref:Tetratricopeptide repeat-containing protein n=1 Tax=Pseudoalteromonas denitrificans DSM 6059 TaxID=1123010 RepID=A0A1I1EWE9_9GAMM|nr:hypothetical protein [Pseudoalteromonas denitrificans]SFB91012.1 Tetratricopeptide repeat-containing protein [Pseudoalteromonas denitrificans DSM 6059]
MSIKNSFPLFNIMLITSSLLLTACTSTTKTNQHLPPPTNLFTNQDLFSEFNVEPFDEIFTLSDDIKHKLDIQMPQKKRSQRTTKDLLHFIFNSANNHIDYQSGATLTANQTFMQQNANCLSLSIMAFSMAEHLGLETSFRRVYIPEYWALEKGFNLLTSHINIKLYFNESKHANAQKVYDINNGIVVDFDENSRKERFRTKNITKQTVAAMFYNNKGAIAMVNAKYNQAYHYFKSATEVAPSYSPAWGNLGILFRINNHLENAELAYQFALNLDPQNNTAKGNLGILYEMTDRVELAQAIQKELELKRKSNPYYHMAKGNEAYVQKRYRSAIAHYKKSSSLDKKLHEPYFGIARSLYQLGDFKQAKRHLKSAKKNAFYLEDKNIYQGKLNSLSAMVY